MLSSKSQSLYQDRAPELPLLRPHHVEARARRWLNTHIGKSGHAGACGLRGLGIMRKGSSGIKRFWRRVIDRLKNRLPQCLCPCGIRFRKSAKWAEALGALVLWGSPLPLVSFSWPGSLNKKRSTPAPDNPSNCPLYSSYLALGKRRAPR